MVNIIDKLGITPSPWRYRPPQGAFGHEVENNNCIMVCQTNHHPRMQKRAKLEAQLISATPEMLEALIFLYDGGSIKHIDIKHIIEKATCLTWEEIKRMNDK